VGLGGEKASVFEGTLEANVPAYLVANENYFGREEVYGYEDDGERFVFFCWSIMKMIRILGWKPDILHCNDWHTGIIPNWLKTIYKDDPFFSRSSTVFTIHNLTYQGIFASGLLEFAGLAGQPLIPEVEREDEINLIARGILFADVINTVSERYAREILTPAYGGKLLPILLKRHKDLFGILNGIDYEIWNPSTDEFIAANFDIRSLERRVENKLALQREANLPVNAEIPLIGIVSRLADQKGFDILSEAINSLMELDLQLVILGTGDSRYHKIFAKVAEENPTKAAVFLRFDPPLARRIYAGSDMFLMPSRFEPCGLGQMIAMRYGSVPIVRKTGGLADSVEDYNPERGSGNGFAFDEYSAESLLLAVKRALRVYLEEEEWRILMERGMRADFSWRASAQKYVKLYELAKGGVRDEDSSLDFGGRSW
jgi:starch synthase